MDLFGATSSPGCSSFGLRQIACDCESVYGPATKEFIHNNFYVDDGLKSTETEDQPIKLIAQARKLCAEGGVQLHKFSSTSREVLSALPLDDQAEGVKELDLSCDDLPVERTLGFQWCVEPGTFQFRIT